MAHGSLAYWYLAARFCDNASSMLRDKSVEIWMTQVHQPQSKQIKVIGICTHEVSSLLTKKSSYRILFMYTVFNIILSIQILIYQNLVQAVKESITWNISLLLLFQIFHRKVCLHSKKQILFADRVWPEYQVIRMKNYHLNQFIQTIWYSYPDFIKADQHHYTWPISY